MSNGEEWLLRPILEGLCQYERLCDTVLDLRDFAIMNEAIEIKYENQARFQKAMEKWRTAK